MSLKKSFEITVNGCVHSSVGTAVTSSIGGPRFKFNHQQYLLEHLFIINYSKDKNKKRDPKCPIFTINFESLNLKKTEWLIRNLCCSDYKILWIFLKLSVSTPWRSKMMGRNSDHNYFEPSHSAKRRLPLKSKPNRQLPQTCYWSQANKSASFRELILSYQILDLDYL